jgi:hypothetical protein
VNLCLMTKEIDATSRRERGQGRGDDTHRPVAGEGKVFGPQNGRGGLEFDCGHVEIGIGAWL